MIVDTRGLSCPQPVVEVKKAAAAGASEIEALIDNATAMANVTRFMKKQGFSVKATAAEPDGSTRVVFSK